MGFTWLGIRRPSYRAQISNGKRQRVFNIAGTGAFDDVSPSVVDSTCNRPRPRFAPHEPFSELWVKFRRVDHRYPIKTLELTSHALLNTILNLENAKHQDAPENLVSAEWCTLMDDEPRHRRRIICRDSEGGKVCGGRTGPLSVAGTTLGVNEPELWTHNSPLAAAAHTIVDLEG